VFETAITLLLALHLLCVNAASGGPLVAAWLDWRAARGDDAAALAAKFLARHALLGLLLGAILGVTIGWLLWNPAYQSLWTGPLRYKAAGAGIEFAFSFVLLLAWWLWLPAKGGGRRLSAALRGVMAMLATTNLLYHFPVLFSVAARLYDRGQVAGETIRGASFRELAAFGETPPLALHVTLSSLAVAGVLLLGLALRWRRSGEAAGADRIALWGGRWALAATLAQLPVGLWTLAVLPTGPQTQIMGASPIGILLFVGSLAAALWLMSELGYVALGETSRPNLLRAMAALLITIFLMTALQRQTRTPQPAISPGQPAAAVSSP